MTPNEISAQDTLLIVDDAHRYPHLSQLIGMVSGSLRTQRGTGPHVMIITPHSQDLAKFNRDGSTGQIYVSHLPGHSEFYMIMPFKDLPQQ